MRNILGLSADQYLHRLGLQGTNWADPNHGTFAQRFDGQMEWSPAKDLNGNPYSGPRVLNFYPRSMLALGTDQQLYAGKGFAVGPSALLPPAAVGALVGGVLLYDQNGVPFVIPVHTKVGP